MKLFEIIKKCLLRLLNNDPEVRQKISDVASVPDKSRKSETEDENKKLKAEIERLKRENAGLDEEKKRLDNELRALRVTLKNTSEDAEKKIQSARDASVKELERAKAVVVGLQEKLQGYEQKLDGASVIEKQYELYRSLPESLRKSMAGIINGETLWKFLISGAQTERQELFWEFCRTEVQKSNGLTYAAILKSLFVFFSENIASLSSASLYELYEPSEGSEFKTDSMIPSNSGAQSGRVELVVLPGLKGVNTGKINKKAVVKLED